MKNLIIQKFKKDKKGMSIGDIWPIISVFGMIAIFMGIIIYVLNSVALQMPNGSAAQNATLAVMTMLINFIPWLGIILLVVAAAIVIGVLVGAFGGGKKRV
jgi:Na+/proline symporter